MKKLLKGDVYYETYYKVCAAMLPMITVGMIGGQIGLGWGRVVAWIAACVGVIAMVALIFRVASASRNSEGGSSVVVGIVSELLALPYALMLSGLIAMLFGIDASYALWIAAAFALLEVAVYAMGARK